MHEETFRKEIVSLARSYKGKLKYKEYPAPSFQNPEEGLNCYGFVRLVAADAGIEIPHHTGCLELWERLPECKPATGDLVFTKGKHVGFYDNDTGTIIHLTKSTNSVSEDSVENMHVTGYRSISPLIRGSLV